LAFPLAENLLDTIPELEDMIPQYHRLLKGSLRSDPDRPALLNQLAALRSQRNALSNQRSDLDKAITHLTEAVLLPPAQHIVSTVFYLAIFLSSRFLSYRQADDLKSSIKYFRFLRVAFHSLDAFDIPKPGFDLPSQLFTALAYNLVSTPGDMVQDLEEMVALIPEFITADILTNYQKHAFESFTGVITKTGMFGRKDTQLVANRAIRVLREAAVLNPDLVISFALATCLAARFMTTLTMSNYEEAIAIADKIVATYSPENSLTWMQKNAMILISFLLESRLNISSRPEYLEDAIHRIRTIVPRFPDTYRIHFVSMLNSLMLQRFDYFGVPGNSGGALRNPHFDLRTKITWPIVDISQAPEMEEKLCHLSEIAAAITNGEIADVGAAVERTRKLLPIQQYSNRWSFSSELVKAFACLLFLAYQSTKKSDYLNDSVTMLRNLRKILVPDKTMLFNVGHMLLLSLSGRLALFYQREDFEELMQLCLELANDASGELFARFDVARFWAGAAQIYMHHSVSIAYETAMSLLQETFVFCPPLRTQHLGLSRAFPGGGRFPLDYASYQIQNGQVKQAVGTLERGRALIWSEMRGFRTSTDQLRTANPVIADKYADINRRLELEAMSIAQSDDHEIVHGETGTASGHHEHTIGHLVFTQRRLLEERNTLITHIQSLPGFDRFLKQPSFNFLNSAASLGPVIIINQSLFSLKIILLLKDSPPSVIYAPSSFCNRADQLEKELLRVGKKNGLDSNDYNLTLAAVLSDLYELVGKQVIERLRKLKVTDKSRVWWCPTGAFCSLPLHAMGPIPSDDGKELYFSDLYIPSYTPSLSALIESRKRRSFSDASDNLKPSILLVAQPETLPGAFGEITVIQSTKTPVTTLISATATPEAVIEGLKEHRFAHFVCHGLLETDKPFDASLELHKGNLTLLEIVRSQLPAAEFAFLSACHTAELTEGSVAGEGLHLAAAMQYCGFPSVVGSMWAMADADGADLSKHFYKAIFADKADQNGVPYHERSARALHIAVKKLRKKRGITLERWVNFSHYGA
jgi:CHAT domain-containing protein/tetratricopeptide (TPR) repeat protein